MLSPSHAGLNGTSDWVIGFTKAPPDVPSYSFVYY